MADSHRPPSFLARYEYAIGGIAGGLASTVVCHPMDLLIIRYSANEGSSIRPQYSSYFDAVKKITTSQGIRGLYQGLTPNVVGATVSWGAYFQIYHWMRSLSLSRSSSHSMAPSQAAEHFSSFTCAFLSGAGCLCVTNPIFMTKTRLCLQYEHSSASRRYSGMIDCLQKIAREEGVRGLYKRCRMTLWFSCHWWGIKKMVALIKLMMGFIAGLICASQGAIQMMLYSHFKDSRCRALGQPLDSKLSTSSYLLFSALSKVIACTVTYPYQVIRTRMQDHNAASRGFLQTVSNTVKGEGIAGLYKGLLMANIRTVPLTVIGFLTYEEVRYLVRTI